MDESIQISLRDAVEPYATVELTRAGVEGESILAATAYGPKCMYSKTLATMFQAAILEDGRSRFAIQDPCYWSPALPFLYEFTLQWTDPTGARREELRVFGLRRLASRRRSLYLDGQRIVLRGMRVERIVPEIVPAARAAEVALIVTEPSHAELDLADLYGIPVIADLREIETDNLGLHIRRLAAYASVFLLLIDRRQLDQLPTDGISKESLLAVAVYPGDGHSAYVTNKRFDAVAVILERGGAPPAWVSSCDKPVIAIRSGGFYADFQHARTACDRLQAELAPDFDLAGYFV